MKKYSTIILGCILILSLAIIPIINFKSSNDYKTDSHDTNNLPISTPRIVKESPLSLDINEKNGNSNNNQYQLKNKQANDIFTQIKYEKKINPILPNIDEITEYFNTDQKKIDNGQKNNISVFNPKEIEEVNILQKINEVSGFFTENKGQVGNDSVKYYIQGSSVWFLDDGVVFEVFDNQTELKAQKNKFDNDFKGFEDELQKVIPKKSVVIKLNFEGANIVKPQGHGMLSHRSNFFYGNDSSKWCRNVPNYREIIYKNLYKNIDLIYYMTELGLKYDFIVHPGGDLNNIKLTIIGLKGLEINDNGDLKINTKLGEIIDSDLYIYQNVKDSKNFIKGNFKILNPTTYSFELDNTYNKKYDLIIDPFLNYSTYVGGSGTDWPREISIDSKGNTYVTGSTNSLNFPVSKNAFDDTYRGNTSSKYEDIFIFKLNKNGSALIYSTYIGGLGRDYGRGLCVDSNNNAIITGFTTSINGTSNFPTTPGAYDTSYNGGDSDIFILKLNQNGSSLIYSTFLGGSKKNNVFKGQDFSIDLAIDSFGNSYVTGWTDSSDFPTTSGAYDISNDGLGDSFVTKLNSNGTKLLYSTYIGGKYVDKGVDIIVDEKGYAYVTGETSSSDFPNTTGSFDTTFNGTKDSYVFKLDPIGSKLIYSTFIGGDNYEVGQGISLDSDGNVIITGLTTSNNFPITYNAYDKTFNGYYDIFILKLNKNGSSILYSTYVGGNKYDNPYDIKIDNEENVYVTGYTYSKNFPTTSNAYDRSFNGYIDAFVLKLNHNGSKLNYSTYIGGNLADQGYEIELDFENNIYITGYTKSINFPTTKGAYDTTYNGNGTIDCFVIKFNIEKSNMPPNISKFIASIAPEGTNVIFTVNATDPDNDTLTYSYDFHNDNIIDISGNNNTTSYTWYDDYTGIAIVNVSDGNFITQANTSVFVYNVAPEVQAGFNQTINEWETAIFNGSFIDPGILDTHNISWQFGENNLSYGFLNISNKFTVPGIYNVKLKVIDDDSGIGEDNLTVTVLNLKPIVDAGEDIFIDEGKKFRFNGSIENPGNDKISLFWDFDIFTDGPDIDNITDNDVDSRLLNASYIFMENNTYIAKLTVKDDDDSIVVDYVNITVYDLKPTANAGLDQFVNTNINITFNASNSYSYPDEIVNYIWDFGNGTNSSGLEVNHSYLKMGTYIVTLTVIDEDGSIDNDTAIIFVNETKHWCGYIAYEDLKNQKWCDYDYNDWGMMMYVKQNFQFDGNLTSMQLEFVGMLKLAGYNHRIHIGIGMHDNVSYNWNSLHYNKTDHLFWKDFGKTSGDLNLTLFNSTKDNTGYSVMITINFSRPINPSLIANIPFDPYMYVFNTKEEIHVGYNQTVSINDAKGSNPFIGLNESPLILIVELDSWTPPKECQRIWKAYPYFDDWIFSQRTKYLDWYKYPT